MNENTNGFKQLTLTQRNTISNNLAAYIFHFETPVILENMYDKIIYIFRSQEDFMKSDFKDNYVQHCPNIDYVNGWLYGAVQAKVGQIKTREVK